jgi:VWFA-related protein
MCSFLPRLFLLSFARCSGRLFSAWWLLIAGCLCGGACAQSPDFTLHTESSLVLVPTLVTDAYGKVIFGLREEDFVLFDNGVEQKIRLDETYASRPVSLVVAVQRGGRAAQVLGKGCAPANENNIFSTRIGKCTTPLHGIARMLDIFLAGPGSEMALLTFDSHVTLRHGFTADDSAITRELEQLPPGDSGSAILDALRQSLQLLQSRPPSQRRVLVIISEKTDRGSTTITFEEATRQIAATNTEIYMVTIDDLDSGRSGLQALAKVLGPTLLSMLTPMPPVGSGGNGVGSGMTAGNTAGDLRGGAAGSGSMASAAPMLAPGSIHFTVGLSRNLDQSNIPQSLANLSGGEYVLFSNSRGLDDALALLANHAQNRYQLSYRPADSPGLHQIHVQMREAMGVQITARNSYWQPAQHRSE